MFAKNNLEGGAAETAFFTTVDSLTYWNDWLQDADDAIENSIDIYNISCRIVDNNFLLRMSFEDFNLNVIFIEVILSSTGNIKFWRKQNKMIKENRTKNIRRYIGGD